jgi:hypothetical protein
MPLRLAHAGDFQVDEDRYFADTAQCLEWFVADANRARGPTPPARRFVAPLWPGRRSPHWKERSRRSHSKSRSNAVHSFRLSPPPLISP